MTLAELLSFFRAEGAEFWRTIDDGDDSRESTCADEQVRELCAEAERLRAEVEMLRGVGCAEDGDGPCGACLKCARARIAELEAESAAAKTQLALYVKTNGELAQWIEELEAENAKLRETVALVTGAELLKP
ncbi:MAG: hypothetical protein ABW217_03865 [Polyangiaceae bacterium]